MSFHPHFPSASHSFFFLRKKERFAKSDFIQSENNLIKQSLDRGEDPEMESYPATFLSCFSFFIGFLCPTGFTEDFLHEHWRGLFSRMGNLAVLLYNWNFFELLMLLVQCKCYEILFTLCCLENNSKDGNLYLVYMELESWVKAINSPFLSFFWMLVRACISFFLILRVFLVFL